MRAALKMALEALEDSVELVRREYEEDWRHGMPTRKDQLDGMKKQVEDHERAISAVREALAQPEQPTWVGLTDEEIDYIYTGIRAIHHDVDSDVLCRAIEAKLKEKNT